MGLNTSAPCFSRIVATVLAVSCCLSVLAGIRASAAGIVFVRPVPGALQSEIEQAVSRIAAQSPLSPAERAKVSRLLDTLDLKDENVNREAKAYFGKLGAQAIPVIAERALAADELVRAKAMAAAQFVAPPSATDRLDPATDDALIALAERSLLDRSAAVRLAALGVLWRVAMNRLPNPPARAVEALKSAASDPNLSVRAAAVLYLQSLVSRTGMDLGYRSSEPPVGFPIFVRALPAGLQQEIDAIVARISARSPLSPQERDRATMLLRSFDPLYGIASRERNDAARACFRQLGVRAVPVPADELTNPDPAVRRKAMSALSFLMKPREERDAAYEEIEAALLALADRSALDRSPSVRIVAVGLLKEVASGRWPKPPARALDAIRSAADDPDYRVRAAAIRYLVYLGQVEGIRQGFGETPIVN